MKIRSIYAIATSLALVATIGTQSANAQVKEDLKCNIPFEFHAAGKLHPAGTYTLSKVNPTTLRLQDERGKGVFIAAEREGVRISDQNWFVFHQYGNRNFLAGAYWSGYSTSLKVPASRAEQEVARHQGKPSPITLAAR